jgi:phospholipid transport system substrate-binding protein
MKAWLGGCLALLLAVSLVNVPADAKQVQAKSADPAVQFMEQVGRDLLAGARARSPLLLSNAVKRYGDVHNIGQYSLGTYRAKLAAVDRANYYKGMVSWMGRYAASKVPDFPVVSYQINGPSYPYKDGVGILVDSRITLRNGTSYDVTWLLHKYGNTYRVRDANVLGLWMTPFLKQLFETYIGENGGNVNALVVTLNR